MGEEAFDETILVADSGTVVVRGGFGRERVWLGLSAKRTDEPDVIVELTERQRRSIGVLLDSYVRGAACNHAELLAQSVETLLERASGIDALAFQEATDALDDYRGWVAAPESSPLCVRCGHGAEDHFLDDNKERALCAECECDRYLNT